MGFTTRFKGLFKSDDNLRRELNSIKGWNPASYDSYLSNLAEQFGVSGGYSGLPSNFVEDSFTKLIDTLPAGKGTGHYAQLRDLTLSNPFGFACIRKISESLAEIEWEAYKIKQDGARHVKADHPIFDLLNGRHGRRTRLSLIEPMVHHLYFGGELFICMTIARSEQTLRPMSLDLLSPEYFRGFIRKGVEEPEGFQRSISRETYRRAKMESIVGYKFAKAKDTNDDALRWFAGKLEDETWGSIDQILHMKRYNSKAPNRGLPLATGARIPLIQSRMAARWNTNLSKTGGRVVGFFSPKKNPKKGQLTPEQRERIERDLDDRMRSRQDLNLPMVMSGAMEYIPNTVTPREADFLTNDKFNARKICSALKVPPILVGDVESVGLGGGSGSKVAEKLFYQNCILPFLDDVLSELSLGVMSRYGDKYKLGYNRSKIEPIQEDLDKLWKRVSVACGGAFASPNDAREIVGMEKRTDDPKYDLIREQSSTPKERTDDRSDNDRDNENENPNNR